MDIYYTKYLFRNYVYDYVQPSSSNHYNRVYLCVYKNKQDDIILEGFNCFRFKNFEEADSITIKIKIRKILLFQDVQP